MLEVELTGVPKTVNCVHCLREVETENKLKPEEDGRYERTQTTTQTKGHVQC